MRLEKTTNVASTRELVVGASLGNLNTIEVSEESQVFEWSFGLTWELQLIANDGEDFLSNSFIRAGKGKVINLAQQQNLDTIEDSLIDGRIMSSRLEVQWSRVENLVNVLLESQGAFWMTLKSMEHRKHFRAINVFASLLKIPFSILVINANKGGDARCW